MKLSYLPRALRSVVSSLAMAAMLPLPGALAAPAPSASSPRSAGDMPLALRLSPSQYRQSIRDIFGPSIIITGSFEPESRVQGLLAIGARESNVSDSGLESYDNIARGIADQVVDERHRATYLGCTPHDPKSSDDACA